MNTVILMGNITQDMELKQTQNSCVLNVSIATNKKVKVNDIWQDKAEFHSLVIWGKRAEAFVQYLGKGDKVLITGELQTRSWENADGGKRYKTEILVNDWEFTSSGKGGDGERNKAQIKETKANMDVQGKTQEKIDNMGEISIEDIPF